MRRSSFQPEVSTSTTTPPRPCAEAREVSDCTGETHVHEDCGMQLRNGGSQQRGRFTERFSGLVRQRDRLRTVCQFVEIHPRRARTSLGAPRRANCSDNSVRSRCSQPHECRPEGWFDARRVVRWSTRVIFESESIRLRPRPLRPRPWCSLSRIDGHGLGVRSHRCPTGNEEHPDRAGNDADTHVRPQ